MPFDTLGKNTENRRDWYFDGLTFIPLLLVDFGPSSIHKAQGM